MELNATFSNPTCEFSIEMMLVNNPSLINGTEVSDKSNGEKGIFYSVKIERTKPDPEDHKIEGVGGDGKGIGCAAQVAVHELRHKAYRHARDDAQEESDSYDETNGKIEKEYGYCSIEYALAVLEYETWKWFSADGERDGVMDSEERSGGDSIIVSDIENCDTYDFARFFKSGAYKSYGDEEIRARKMEASAEYHVELDWANPGCQYSNKPYGPKK